MILAKIEAYTKEKGIDPRFIAIDKRVDESSFQVIPIWLVNDADIIHSGLPSAFDYFEIFRRSTRCNIDRWIKDRYQGKKISVYVNYFSPEYLMGFDLTKKREENESNH